MPAETFRTRRAFLRRYMPRRYFEEFVVARSPSKCSRCSNFMNWRRSWRAWICLGCGEHYWDADRAAPATEEDR